jgi:hypothetical protein
LFLILPFFFSVALPGEINKIMMFHLESDFCLTANNGYASSGPPNPPLSDLTQYINPHVKK